MQTIEEKRAYYRKWSKTNSRSPEAKERQKAYDRARSKLPHNRLKVQKWYKKTKEENHPKLKKYYNMRSATNRQKVIAHYSNNKNECACCGEKHFTFLCIDHINGGGGKHRKELGHGNMCWWIIKNNFPTGFRILCHNCNMSLGFYGFCPHSTVVENKDCGSYQEQRVRGVPPASRTSHNPE